MFLNFSLKLVGGPQSCEFWRSPLSSNYLSTSNLVESIESKRERERENVEKTWLRKRKKQEMGVSIVKHYRISFIVDFAKWLDLIKLCHISTGGRFVCKSIYIDVAIIYCILLGKF